VTVGERNERTEDPVGWDAPRAEDPRTLAEAGKVDENEEAEPGEERGSGNDPSAGQP